VTAVCMAVRDLIHECGNTLSLCFSDSQVEETKQKQRDGLKTILAKHYTQDKMEKCFLKDPEELKPELNTSDIPQEEKIRRNIEALLEFTTPPPTFTTPAVTLTTTASTTIRTTTATRATTTATTTTSILTTTTTTATTVKYTTTVKLPTVSTTIRVTGKSTTAQPSPDIQTTIKVVRLAADEVTAIVGLENKITTTTTTTQSASSGQNYSTIKTTTTNSTFSTTPPTTIASITTTTSTTTTPLTTTTVSTTNTLTTIRVSTTTTASTTTTVSTTTRASTTITSEAAKSTFPYFDRGTTHSPKEPFKCEESEITETRDNYERCASNKIGEITAWVERKQRKRRRRRRSGGQNDDDSILTVCNAVRQLLYDCGNELGWCFTEDQVSETRFKQRQGLETILAQHYTPEKLEMCFMQENTVTQVVVVENITEGNRDTTDSVVDIAEDISENTISDSGDRNPRVLPSSKHSSSPTVNYLSLIQIICLVTTLLVTI